MSLTRRSLVGALAGISASGAWIEVNAQGQKVLTVTIPSNPTTFDPLNQNNHDAMVVSQLIYDNLLEVDGDGNVIPSLALSLPEISDDGKTYTFRLREGVKFQNGATFTAADVKYSYDYMLNPANKAQRRSYWEAIREVEVISDFSVRFRLARPYRPLLASMTKYMAIFPTGSRENAGENTFQSAPIGLGTGPAIFSSAQSGSHIELRRNPSYWGQKPDWDIVRILISGEANARIAALMSGQTDVVGGPAARDFLRLSKGSSGITGSAKPALGAAMLMMHNCKNAPFDDPDFRKAVARGFDRSAIATRIYGGLLEPTSVLVPAASPYHDKQAAELLNFNVDAAKQHLAASKHARTATFDLAYPTDAYLLDVRDTALYIQSALSAVGITVNLKPLETGQMFGEIIKGNLQTVLWTIVGTTYPTFLMQALYGPGQQLAAGINYTNDKLTALFEKSNSATPEELRPIMSDIQQVLAAEAPAAFIGTPNAFNLWRARIQNFDVNTGITLRLRNVKLAV